MGWKRSEREPGDTGAVVPDVTHRSRETRMSSQGAVDNQGQIVVLYDTVLLGGNSNRRLHFLMALG